MAVGSAVRAIAAAAVMIMAAFAGTAWFVADGHAIPAILDSARFSSRATANQSSSPVGLPPPVGMPVKAAPFSFEGLRYVAEDTWTDLGHTRAGFSSEANLTFQNVTFRVWLENVTARWWVVMLRGIAVEPNGVGLEFLLFPNATVAGGGSNTSATTYFSPDGVFGARWVAWNGTVLELELAVSDPAPEYATTNVTPPWSDDPHVGPAPTNLSFHGVNFNLVVQGWGLTVAPSLNISATFPNGTVYWITIPGGPPLIVCSAEGSPSSPNYYYVGATACEEGAATDHSVAASGGPWGSLVTLMVRIP